MHLSLYPRLCDGDAYQRFITAHPVAAVYFSGPDCAVCRALAPKLTEALARHFPELMLAWVDCAASPALAAQNQVFSVPLLVVYFAGQEAVRQARGFSVTGLCRELERPYRLFFPS